MFNRISSVSLTVLFLTSCSESAPPPSPDAGLSEPSVAPSRSKQLIQGLQTAPAASDPILRASETSKIQRDGANYRPWFPSNATRTPTSVVWPAEADSPFEVTDLTSGAGIAVRLLGAAPVDIEIVDGFGTYLDVLPGANQVHRALADGTEDYIAFASAPSVHEVTYSVALSERVAGLRFVAGVFELLDSQGTPRLRMSPPFLVDAEGARHNAEVAVEGCAYDTSPAPPWGRRPTAPEASECRVRISWDGQRIAWPAVLDPTWTSTGNMVWTRNNHQAALTVDGRVLVGSSGTAELFDPTTGTFAAAAAPTQSSYGCTLTALPDGRIVAAGGGTYAPAVEIYDPTTGTWALGANLITPRARHGAALLNNGKVLIFGGFNGAYLNAAELYDPTTDTTSPTGFMGSPRSQFAHSVLSNGKVLASGGSTSSILKTADVYDPASGTWASAGTMAVARRYHAQASLPGGGALVIGGYNTSYVTTTAIYDSSTNNWSNGPNNYTAGTNATLTLARNKLLAAGGEVSSSYQSKTQLYDEANKVWLSSPNMLVARYKHVATVLLDGTILVTGGTNSSGSLRSAEIFTPSIECASDSECSTGHCVDGYCCDTDCSAACDRCDVPAKEGACTRLVSGQTSADPSCSPYLCNGTSSDCPVSCASDSACEVGYYCSSNQCVPKSDLGTSCQNANECLSGRCSDGVCCNSWCSSSCDACSVALGASSDGTCTALTGSGSPSCAPYLCNGTNYSCPSSCASDAGCVSGYYCDGSNKCVLLKQIGDACTSASECAYGHCVDGRCCDSACDSPCDRCSASGSLGICTTASAGYSSSACHPYTCDGVNVSCPTSCVDTGTSCAFGYWCVNAECVPKLQLGEPCSSGGDCQSYRCVEGVCCDATCTGPCDACTVSNGAAADGTCSLITGPGTPSCSGHACSGASAYCPTQCTSDSECESGYACVSNDCIPKKANGEACAAGTNCTSGFCVDGYCCDDACLGPCEVCASNLGATDNGVCTPSVGPGSPSCSPYTCTGNSGVCPTGCTTDAVCTPGSFCISGQCQSKKANGEACADASECASTHCADGICCNEACAAGGCDRCDLPSMLGICRIAADGDPGANPPCAPYVCDGQQAACPASCANNAQCTTGLCVGGTCVAKLSNGMSCTQGDQCTSGFCIDGVCCNTACTGQCSVCNSAGSEGVCRATTGAPIGTRPACAGTGVCQGTCGGVVFDACVYPSAATECAPPSCTNGTEVSASLCDGIGGCIAGTETLCGPSGCAGDHCASDGGPEDASADGANSDASEDAETDAPVDATGEASVLDAETDGATDAALEATADAPIQDALIQDAPIQDAPIQDALIQDAPAETNTDAASIDATAPSDAALSDGAPSDDAASRATEGDSGSCGCRAPRGSQTAGWPSLALALMALCARRRQTRPRDDRGLRSE